MMKLQVFFIVFSLLLAPLGMAQTDTLSRERMIFPAGERVEYLAHYGFINAGEAVIRLSDEQHQINGKSCYKVEIEGRTTGMFRLGMRVDDLWRSYIDTQTGLPQRFHRDIKENKYTKVETVNFDQEAGKAYVRHVTKSRPEKKETYEMDPHSQDMISGYYHLRGIDFSQYQKGDTITIDAFFEDKPYDFRLRFLGKSQVKTRIGKYDALVMAPIMPESSIFDGENSIQFWISDDKYRIPLKIRANMFIGAVEVEVVEYQNDEIHLD